MSSHEICVACQLFNTVLRLKDSKNSHKLVSSLMYFFIQFLNSCFSSCFRQSFQIARNPYCPPKSTTEQSDSFGQQLTNVRQTNICLLGLANFCAGKMIGRHVACQIFFPSVYGGDNCSAPKVTSALFFLL